MSNIDDLEKKLEKFYNHQKKEFDLSEVEKWMIKELGVERKGKKGIKVIYFHKALTIGFNDKGHFTVHIIHGKGKEQIRRFDFRKYMNKPLKIIIEFIRAERSNA